MARRTEAPRTPRGKRAPGPARGAGAPARPAAPARRVPLEALRVVLVTPGDRPPGDTADLARAALAGGVTAVVLREPRLADEARRALARELATCCRAAGALLFVHNDVEAALAAGAHGVHLGRGGPSLGAVRRLHPDLRLGRSGHWPPVADDLAADYLTLSPFRVTPKSHPRPLLTEGQVAAVLCSPGRPACVALGGLRPPDVAELPAGLCGVAAIRAFAAVPDPAQAARAFRSEVEARLGPAGVFGPPGRG